MLLILKVLLQRGGWCDRSVAKNMPTGSASQWGRWSF